jgi:hypothetical protein
MRMTLLLRGYFSEATNYRACMYGMYKKNSIRLESSFSIKIYLFVIFFSLMNWKSYKNCSEVLISILNVEIEKNV